MEVAPDAVSGSVPKGINPSENVTFPVGAVVPLAGFTVAVTLVEPPDATVDGLAEAEVVVATGAAVTVTDTVPLEFVKLPVAI